MFWLELAVVILVLVVGTRIGDVFLGMVGGLGVAILAFLFHVAPTSPPVDVMLIILSVVVAAAALQAAGGLDYLVILAEKMLRRNPKHITVMAPLVAYLFTFMAGTGHVVYSLLPVIVEVSRDSGIRPERPMSVAVIASQQAITACPISAAMAAMVGFLAPMGIGIATIMAVAVPATIIGVIASSFVVMRKGKDLADDPEYQRRVKEGMVKAAAAQKGHREITPQVKLSVVLFLLGSFSIVFLGMFPELRPAFETAKGVQPISMSITIQIVMLSFAAFIVLLCRPPVQEILNGTVFRAGALAVVCCFGLAWMSDSFVQGQLPFIKENVQSLMQTHTWLLAAMMFAVSALVTSQAATTVILLPLGLALGLPAYVLIGAWPAVNGYFFFPIAGQCLAACAFDTTGTTRIGKYVFNHSFMLPGIVNIVVAVTAATLIGKFIL